MTNKTKLILLGLTGLFLTLFAADTNDNSQPAQWTSSYITCADQMCVENITFPSLHITVDSKP